MTPPALFGISVLFSFVAWGLVTRWYIWPAAGGPGKRLATTGMRTGSGSFYLPSRGPSASLRARPSVGPPGLASSRYRQLSLTGFSKFAIML